MAGGRRLNLFLTTEHPPTLPGPSYDSLTAGSLAPGTITSASKLFPEVPTLALWQLPGNQGL